MYDKSSNNRAVARKTHLYDVRRRICFAPAERGETNGKGTCRGSSRETLRTRHRWHCKIFGCSIPTANRIKKSGVIDSAITQVGRKIVVDSELALSLAKEAGAIKG